MCFRLYIVTIIQTLKEIEVLIMSSLKILYSKLNNVLDKHAPFKCKRVKRYQQPGWYSEDVTQARCMRDKFKNNSNFPQYEQYVVA